MKSIDEHIQKDQSEIESAKAEGNLPKVRHLTEELKELEEYKDHHQMINMTLMLWNYSAMPTRMNQNVLFMMIKFSFDR